MKFLIVIILQFFVITNFSIDECFAYKVYENLAPKSIAKREKAKKQLDLTLREGRIGTAKLVDTVEKKPEPQKEVQEKKKGAKSWIKKHWITLLFGVGSVLLLSGGITLVVVGVFSGYVYIIFGVISIVCAVGLTGGGLLLNYKNVLVRLKSRTSPDTIFSSPRLRSQIKREYDVNILDVNKSYIDKLLTSEDFLQVLEENRGINVDEVVGCSVHFIGGGIEKNVYKINITCKDVNRSVLPIKIGIMKTLGVEAESMNEFLDWAKNKNLFKKDSVGAYWKAFNVERKIAVIGHFVEGDLLKKFWKKEKEEYDKNPNGRKQYSFYYDYLYFLGNLFVTNIEVDENKKLKGMVHCDLTPTNVIYNPESKSVDGKITIIDYGFGVGDNGFFSNDLKFLMEDVKSTVRYKNLAAKEIRKNDLYNDYVAEFYVTKDKATLQTLFKGMLVGVLSEEKRKEEKLDLLKKLYDSIYQLDKQGYLPVSMEAVFVEQVKLINADMGNGLEQYGKNKKESYIAELKEISIKHLLVSNTILDNKIVEDLDRNNVKYNLLERQGSLNQQVRQEIESRIQNGSERIKRQIKDVLLKTITIVLYPADLRYIADLLIGMGYGNELLRTLSEEADEYENLLMYIREQIVRNKQVTSSYIDTLDYEWMGKGEFVELSDKEINRLDIKEVEGIKLRVVPRILEGRPQISNTARVYYNETSERWQILMDEKFYDLDGFVLMKKFIVRYEKYKQEKLMKNPNLYESKLNYLDEKSIIFRAEFDRDATIEALKSFTKDDLKILEGQIKTYYEEKLDISIRDKLLLAGPNGSMIRLISKIDKELGVDLSGVKTILEAKKLIMLKMINRLRNSLIGPNDLTLDKLPDVEKLDKGGELDKFVFTSLVDMYS